MINEENKSEGLEALDDDSLNEVMGGFENATLVEQQKRGRYPFLKKENNLKIGAVKPTVMPSKVDENLDLKDKQNKV